MSVQSGIVRTDSISIFGMLEKQIRTKFFIWERNFLYE